ncbi:hypothetical protein BO70DRAFT_202772 [Aspergillus heteromorphus CBS 117.55]|uniref:Uncharacterized protein n=1 Tax=Aspergillus heteromorphus CBS 117.55 TaxID=1448321 RepID=A0A317WU41_9EURO|nr:uncharacterized protein BO70DRAFT_202772 [Aspergillus heteromorphus CBS 117.55]PWY87760.1 hypothetical protein BO70DRAFT_202772 [Aspergillus heteromorphus CBS 117.55]
MQYSSRKTGNRFDYPVLRTGLKVMDIAHSPTRLRSRPQWVLDRQQCGSGANLLSLVLVWAVHGAVYCIAILGLGFSSLQKLRSSVVSDIGCIRDPVVPSLPWQIPSGLVRGLHLSSIAQ